MDKTHGRNTSLRSIHPPETRRRILLFPLPYQGHINPMFQLAYILHTQGFKIVIIHTQYNSPNHSSYPQFRFRPINDRFSEVEHLLPTIRDPSYFIKYLNRSCEDPFRDCLIELLDEEPVACLISDAMFYFTQAVADDLKIPRMVLRTSSLGCAIGYGALPYFSPEGGFNITKKGPFLMTGSNAHEGSNASWTWLPSRPAYAVEVKKAPSHVPPPPFARPNVRENAELGMGHPF
ncbi:hypothetical protein R6Q57_005155 [Mikania cordata]